MIVSCFALLLIFSGYRHRLDLLITFYHFLVSHHIKEDLLFAVVHFSRRGRKVRSVSFKLFQFPVP